MNTVKIAGAVIFIALIALIFFSKTIYTFNIPEVTAVAPKNGKLSKYETTTGVADWANVREIYFEAGGKIEELYVEEGDAVKSGQELARLSFDTDDVLLKITQSDIDRDKLRVSVEDSQLRVSRLKEQIADLEKEEYEPDEISDYNITQAEARAAKAEEDLATLSRLYEAGVVARQDVENAEHDLSALRLELENLIKTKAESEKKSGKDIEEKEKSRAKQIADLKYEIESLQKDIASKNLDIKKNIEERAVNEKLLADYDDNMIIYAPEDATVISLSVKEGQAVSKDQLMAGMGVGNVFTVKCGLSLSNNFVVTGDECRLSNTDHEFTASVSKIAPTEAAKEVTIRIESDEITAGETFDIEFGKESAKSAVLVPNGAVNKDSDGYFVYSIKKRKGILGDEYFAERLPIYAGDSDNDNTIVTRGIMFFEPIVLLSDKPFENGGTIRVKNEGDFFVD